MHLELRHLRAIRAIHEAGGLARAAEGLNITQSALSHQVKAMEDQAGVDLFVRRSKPLKLSAAGQRLLRLAEEVLPEITRVEEDFRALREGRSGRLHLAIECHACFDWLFPVLEQFRHAWPDVDVDIRPNLQFAALPALAREEIDLVISSDPEGTPGIEAHELFTYEPVFVASARHPLAARDAITAEDLRGETLITYPVERTKLDVFTQLLTPAGIEPASVRQVELSAVILLLVASQRGVTVLPDWVLGQIGASADVITRPLGDGMRRSLYAVTREGAGAQPFMAEFLTLARRLGGKAARV